MLLLHHHERRRLPHLLLLLLLFVVHVWSHLKQLWRGLLLLLCCTATKDDCNRTRSSLLRLLSLVW